MIFIIFNFKNCMKKGLYFIVEKFFLILILINNYYVCICVYNTQF